MRAIVLATSLLLAGCSSTRNTSQATSTTNSGASTTASAKASTGVDLHVKGMGCPLCATNVRKSLERVDGVGNATINLGSGVVHVTPVSGQAPDEESLRRAVSAAGFTVDSVEQGQ